MVREQPPAQPADVATATLLPSVSPGTGYAKGLHLPPAAGFPRTQPRTERVREHIHRCFLVRLVTGQQVNTVRSLYEDGNGREPRLQYGAEIINVVFRKVSPVNAEIELFLAVNLHHTRDEHTDTVQCADQCHVLLFGAENRTPQHVSGNVILVLVRPSYRIQPLNRKFTRVGKQPRWAGNAVRAGVDFGRGRGWRVFTTTGQRKGQGKNKGIHRGHIFQIGGT